VKITLETVQGGYVLVDCDECGTIGVWPTRGAAKVAKDIHDCAAWQETHRTDVPGKVATQVLIGPRPCGQGEED
jgi:hypothetical protein